MYTITFLGEVIKTSHFLDLFLCVQVYTKACHYVHNNISRRGDQDVPLRTAGGRQLRRDGGGPRNGRTRRTDAGKSLQCLERSLLPKSPKFLQQPMSIATMVTW